MITEDKPPTDKKWIAHASRMRPDVYERLSQLAQQENYSKNDIIDVALRDY